MSERDTNSIASWRRFSAHEAATLMSHVPPVGWADVATKHDLAQLREYMNLRFEAIDQRFLSIDQRFDAMEARFDGKLAQLEGRIYDRMAQQSATFLRATVLSIVGSVLTVASLVFAARLL